MRFLQGPATFAQRIYILGDLFDIWVGQDLHQEFYTQIQTALKAVADKGIPLFYMAGNRDFLIDDAYLAGAGCEKLKDPTVISLYGIPTLLTHGDLLCTQDKAYQRYRKIVQHPIARAVFRKLPKKLREKIGLKLRQKSQQYQQGQDLNILDVSLPAVDKIMNQYAVKQIIHGHVHRPQIHDLNLQGTRAKRIVLGDWHSTATIAIFTPAHNALATFSANSGIQIKGSYALAELGAPLAP